MGTITKCSSEFTLLALLEKGPDDNTDSFEKRAPKPQRHGFELPTSGVDQHQ